MILQKTLFTPLGSSEVSSRQRRSRRRSGDKDEQNKTVGEPVSRYNDMGENISDVSLFIEPSWQHLSDYYAPIHEDHQQQPRIDQLEYNNNVCDYYGGHYWGEDTANIPDYFQDRPHSFTSPLQDNTSSSSFVIQEKTSDQGQNFKINVQRPLSFLCLK